MEKFRKLIIVQTLHVHLFFSHSLIFRYFSAACLYFTTVAELSLRINFSNYITCAGKDKTHELGFAILSTFNYSFIWYTWTLPPGRCDFSLQWHDYVQWTDWAQCWLLGNLLLLFFFFFFFISPPLLVCVMVGFPRDDIWVCFACLSREAPIGRGEGEVTGP